MVMKHEDLIALEMIAHRIASRHVAEEMKRYRAQQERMIGQLRNMFGNLIDASSVQRPGCAPDCARCYGRRVSYHLGRLVRRRIRRELNSLNGSTKLNLLNKSVDEVKE